MPDLAHDFIDQSRRYLRDDYLPKIERCLEGLSPEDLWWRPNEASNSIGNLILHLAGNARQWIVSGVGGAADVRQRRLEFDEREPRSAEEVLRHLRSTLGKVDQVLARLGPDRLLEQRQIQCNDVTVLQAVYHVVEHFSTHTGQIVYITKQRRGVDLAFYAVTDGIARPQW